MVRTFAIALILVCGACSGEASRQSDSGQAQPDLGPIYVPLNGPVLEVKELPPLDDPAIAAMDEPSCLAAGGEWAETYRLGLLSSRTPFDAEYYGDNAEDALKTYSKQCWSTRQPVIYADGGKVCGGQADCEMNCIPRSLGNGRFDTPRCQTSSLEQPNCGYIYDQGRYYESECVMQ